MDKTAPHHSDFTRPEFYLPPLSLSCVYSRRSHNSMLTKYVVRLTKCIWHFFSPPLSAFWSLERCHLLTKLLLLKETPPDLELCVAWLAFFPASLLKWSLISPLKAETSRRWTRGGRGGSKPAMASSLLLKAIGAASWSISVFVFCPNFSSLSFLPVSPWTIEDGVAVF